jgi:hypothetical protein
MFDAIDIINKLNPGELYVTEYTMSPVLASTIDQELNEYFVVHKNNLVLIKNVYDLDNKDVNNVLSQRSNAYLIAGYTFTELLIVYGTVLKSNTDFIDVFIFDLRERYFKHLSI